MDIEIVRLDRCDSDLTKTNTLVVSLRQQSLLSSNYACFIMIFESTSFSKKSIFCLVAMSGIKDNIMAQVAGRMVGANQC